MVREPHLRTHGTGEATGKQAFSYLAGGSINGHNPIQGSVATNYNCRALLPNSLLLGICPISWLGYVGNDTCIRWPTTVSRMMVKYWKYHKCSLIECELDQRSAKRSPLPVYVSKILLGTATCPTCSHVGYAFTLPWQSWVVVTVTCKVKNIYSLTFDRKFAFLWVRWCVHAVQYYTAVNRKGTALSMDMESALRYIHIHTHRK